jgi:uncharacterized repeat protein (TIGR04138 family)
VTAPELVDGLCHAARRRFGMLAGLVLERWGLRNGDDVGEIVFQLIERGVLSRREEDAREDFHDTAEFGTALEESYFDR